MAKKVVPIVICILILGALGCFIGLNWNSFKVMLSGAKIYTHEQIEESYDKGYNDANTNEQEYLSQLDYYKALTEDKEIEILNLTSQINNLTNDNIDYEKQLANLTSQKENLELQVKNLQDVNSLNETTIAELNSQKTTLESQVAQLTALKEQNESKIQELTAQLEELQNSNNGLNTQIIELNNQITQLNNENDILENNILDKNTQITNLENLNNQLQNANNVQTQTIEDLNIQINSLNTQIDSLTDQVLNNHSNVSLLNKRIQDLEESIAYYEEYIRQLETEKEVVATFMFDGAVYEIQKVDKNSTLTIENPTSTETLIFNGWLVDGELVDLSTYTITTNTTFVADITHKYLVQFMVDNEIVSSSYVVENQFATAPTNVNVDGYEIESWTLDNVSVNLSSYAITTDTTFIAQLVKVHTIVLDEDIMGATMTYTFKAKDGSIPDISNYPHSLDSYSAVNKQAEIDIIAENYFGYKALNLIGWINLDTNEVVDNPLTLKYNSDAHFSIYTETVLHFVYMVDDDIYADKYYNADGVVIAPENPVKEGCDFVGWSINGEEPMDVNGLPLNSDMAQLGTIYLVAVFERKAGFQTESFVSLQSLNNVPFESAIHLTSSTEKGYAYIYNNNQTLISRYSFETNSFDEPITFISRIDDGSYYWELVNKDILVYSYNNNFYLVDFSNSSCKQIGTFTSYESNKSSGFKTAFLNDNNLVIVYKSSSSQSGYSFRYYDLISDVLSNEFTNMNIDGSIVGFAFFNNCFFTLTHTSSGSAKLSYKNISTNATSTKSIGLSSFKESALWKLVNVSFDGSIVHFNVISYYNSFNFEYDFNAKTFTLINSEDRSDPVVNQIATFEHNGVVYYTKAYDFGYYNENNEQISLNNELPFSLNYILFEDRVVLIQNNISSSFIVYYFD